MVAVSRFADMTYAERQEDPAYRDYDPYCSHPPHARTQEDDGGNVCSPSFYCRACNRLVIDPDDDDDPLGPHDSARGSIA